MAAETGASRTEARAGIVLGALLADAATMGLHWLYDPDRLAMIETVKDPVFLSADRQHFDGTKGYFAHAGKGAGDLSQYGAVLALAMGVLIETGGRTDIPAYQKRYLAFFGPGGGWQGYIDRPTRGTLARIGQAVGDDTPEVTGIDDDQLPALSPVPAVVAAAPDADDLEDRVTRMVRVTNDNPLAIEAALITARLIQGALNAGDLAPLLSSEAEKAGEVLKPLLLEALDRRAEAPVDVAGHFGRACHVHQGLPVVFHILGRAGGFEEGVRANILAGGDSCGRSMALGSILGARFGFGGEQGIPIPWLPRLTDGSILADQAYRLTASA